MKRRQLLFLIPLAHLAPVKHVQAATKRIATPGPECPPDSGTKAPYIRASSLIQALLQESLVPAAKDFVMQSQALVTALSERSWVECRPAWTSSMLAWETLAAVPVATLVERRSARTIDFWPTRPAQIQALLDAGPERFDPAAPPNLSASAMGLPALEWLLFRQERSTSAAALAAILATHVLREARILHAAHHALLQTAWDEADAWTAYGEWFGQAVGSLEQLRLKKLAPHTRGKDSAIWARGLSGQTGPAWLAHARGLQAFLTGPLSAQPASRCGPTLPVPGTLHSLLLGRGYPTEGARLQTLTRAMLQAVARATPANAPSLQGAQRATDRLQHFVSEAGSDLFDFSQGFTDADGD